MSLLFAVLSALKDKSFGLSGGKSGMFFVSLVPLQENGQKWDDKSQQALSTLFSRVGISYLARLVILY